MITHHTTDDNNIQLLKGSRHDDIDVGVAVDVDVDVDVDDNGAMALMVGVVVV